MSLRSRRRTFLNVVLRFLNFSKSNIDPDRVAALAEACQPAVFGKGQETVLDETYRKAGKMDADAFLARLDVYRSGLVGAVHTGLLAGERERDTIRAELYKLNVYGTLARAALTCM